MRSASSLRTPRPDRPLGYAVAAPGSIDLVNERPFQLLVLGLVFILRRLGKTRWIPHSLTEAQKVRRVNGCREMMQRCRW
ncbi:hypothetical protein EVAR_24138_1 [Eumeta japonica]|uniref:Uncharacterized protein n=1 Tax=Eumeta variegata TaxID=151549 RepID=A0A4C1YLW5_EUMVA|nr:hypothetical protein EVAR_24138_1 [Eumeta japonica]